MNSKVLVSLAIALLSTGTTAASAQEVTEIRWGTSAVGSSGHRALTALGNLLNEKMEGYRVIVQPTPGAIVSVKGFATGEFEGYYGSDIAFYELANNISRFEGFQENIEVQPVQSFWAFTVEVGLGVHVSQRENFDEWGDLSGQPVFTGPRPWDTRAQIERALQALGIEHEYVDVDLSTAGSLLESGQIAGLGIYTNAEATTAPWIIETSLMTDWAILNPSEEELGRLHEAGFTSTEVTNAAEVFQEEVRGRRRRSSCHSTTASTSASRSPRRTCTACSRSSRRTPPSSPRPMPALPRSPRTCPACRCVASRRRATSFRCIRASPGTCARRASGTRHGIPGSQRNSSRVRRTGARAGSRPRPPAAPAIRP